MATSGDLITRSYGDFRGVDFSNDPGMVNLSRSPDALNVWKDYSEESSDCIQTRPGYKKLGKIGNKINSMFILNDTTALVHSGTNLYLWSNFPEEPVAKLLKNDMNDRRSQMYQLGSSVYINDGKNYLVYVGNKLKNVSDNAYVPTTTVSRKPTGGGKRNEDVNLLTPKRKNTFLGDGSSKDYYLDSTNITEVLSVKVNDTVLTYITDYEYNAGLR